MSAKSTEHLHQAAYRPLACLGLMFSLLLLLSIAPSHAQNAGNAEGVERAQAEENRDAKPSKRQNNKTAKRQAEPEAPAKKPLELEALKEPVAPPKPDWQTSLATTLAAVGIGAFWHTVGVTGALAQLVASLLLLIFVLLGLRKLLQQAQGRSILGGSVKYVEDHPHSSLMEEPRDTVPPAKPAGKPTPQTTRAPEAPRQQRVEPSMQAPPARTATNSQFGNSSFGNSSFGNTGFGNSTFANSSFAPGNSQQAQARTDNPAERAQLAAASAAAAAKAALANKNGGAEDYGTIPPNFNVAGFIRKARLYFIRLQIAWDKSDIQNISEITTPEICEEFRRQIVARGPSDNCTDVVAFDAEILGVKAVGQKFVVTVKMTGIVKESMNNAQEAFEEVWRMSRSISGKETWLLADIKQY